MKMVSSTVVPTSQTPCLSSIKAHFQALSAQAHITDALSHRCKGLSLSPALSDCSSLHLSPEEALLISSEVIKRHKIKSAASYLAQSPFWRRGNNSMWRGNWVLTHTEGYMPRKQNVLFSVKTVHHKTEQWDSSRSLCTQQLF